MNSVSPLDLGMSTQGWGLLRLAALAQDFACGLKRPQFGSTLDLGMKREGRRNRTRSGRWDVETARTLESDEHSMAHATLQQSRFLTTQLREAKLRDSE